MIRRCPIEGLTVEQRELISMAGIFIETNLPPTAGGQDDQPWGFFETVSAVKSYQHQLEKQANENAKT